MLDSSIWMDRPAREVFITALLMAEPVEFTEPQAVIRVASLELDGWDVPPGWYGIARAAGPGIVNRSRLDFLEGLEALARLCAPEMQSRTPKWEGRRMARISGGFVLLNYDDYRQRDYGSAERTRRYRERQRNAASDVTSDGVTRNSDDVTRDRDASRSRSRSRSREDQDRSTTEPTWLAEFKAAYPERAGDQNWRGALKAANARIAEGHTPAQFVSGALRYRDYVQAIGKQRTEFVKQAATFLGPSKPFLEPWTVPLTKGDQRLQTNLSAAEDFMRRTGTP